MQDSDPLAVIAREAPQFSDEEAIAIARQYYGLEVSVRPLVSERDQNFHLRTGGDREYVLKIANTAEDPLVTDFQIQALIHIETYQDEHGVQICAPEILRTIDGETHINLESGGAQHVARVVSYVDGVPLGDREPSPALCRDMGACLARLGQALRDFEHPGSGQSLLWDMQQALRLREITHHIPDERLRREVDDVLDSFERNALPVFPSIRAQVIHSDLNPDNVLTGQKDADSVVGVIDFGDMLRAPLIVDPAIAASYLRVFDGDPLAKIAELLAGYHSVTPLEQAEIDILFDLIRTRLAATISILHWRASAKAADDPYLVARGSESTAEKFLERLNEIPRENAIKALRQVCASVTDQPLL